MITSMNPLTIVISTRGYNQMVKFHGSKPPTGPQKSGPSGTLHGVQSTSPLSAPRPRPPPESWDSSSVTLTRWRFHAGLTNKTVMKMVTIPFKSRKKHY